MGKEALLQEVSTPIIVTAQDVFNFDPELILPTSGKKFSADFLNGNHVLDQAERSIHTGKVSIHDIETFIEHIATYPQIQIPTVNKNGQYKSLYGLDDMIRLHTASIEQTLDEQLELAVFYGDDCRIRSLDILEKSVRLFGIQKANSASITLDSKYFKPDVLVPLFNITTAVKLADIAQIELPSLFYIEPQNTYPSVPDERYF